MEHAFEYMEVDLDFEWLSGLSVEYIVVQRKQQVFYIADDADDDEGNDINIVVEPKGNKDVGVVQRLLSDSKGVAEIASRIGV